MHVVSRRLVDVAATALLLTACANRPPDFVYPRSSHVALSAVPTELKANFYVGWAAVEVFIDGHGPWNFLLDSGAAPYVIDQRLADELKLERVDLSSGGKGVAVDDGHDRDASLMEAVRIHELRAGPLVERDTGAMVFDLSPIERATANRVDGILPASAFREGLLTLDFVGNSVTVAAGELPLEDGKDVLPLVTLWDSPLPYIELEFGGETCRVLIDSGSLYGLEVPAALESRLRFRSAPVVVGVSGTIAGQLPSRVGRLNSTIAWGRHRIEDPIVEIKAGDHAIAGIGLLRKFRTTFDFRNSRVRFERAGDEPIRSPSVRSPGAGFQHRRDAWTVLNVLEGGPAARVGLQVGDRIESVDGQAVGAIEGEAWQAILQTKDELRLRVVDADGTTREITLPVATLVE